MICVCAHGAVWLLIMQAHTGAVWLLIMQADASTWSAKPAKTIFVLYALANAKMGNGHAGHTLAPQGHTIRTVN